MSDGGDVRIPVLPSFANFEKLLVAPMRAAAQKAGGELNAGLKAAAVVGGAIVGGLIVKGFEKAIGTTVTLAGDVRKLSRELGLTAEDASRLRVAGEELGVSTDSLSKSFGIFSKHLVDGGAAFLKYGISLKDSSGNTKPFLSLLGEVSDKFNSLPPGVERTAFALDLFGRGGKDLIPVLQQGSAGLEELYKSAAKAGLVMSGPAVEAAKQLEIAQRQLHESVQGFEVSLSTAAIPALTEFAKGLTVVVEFANLIPAPVKTAALAVVGLAVAIKAAQVATAFFKGTIGGVVGALSGQTAATVAATGAAAAESVGLEALSGFQGQAAVTAQALAVAEAEAAAAEEAAALAGGASAGVLGVLGPVAIVAGAGILAYAAASKTASDNAKEMAKLTDGLVEVMTRKFAPSLDEVKAKIESQPIPGWAKDMFLKAADDAAVKVAAMAQAEQYNTYQMARSASQSAVLTLNLYGLKGAHEAAKLAAQGQWAAELQLAGGLLGVRGAELQAQSAAQQLRDAHAAVNAALKDHGKNSREYRDALAAEQQAILGSAQAQLSLKQQGQSYADLLEGPVKAALDDVKTARDALNAAQAAGDEPAITAATEDLAAKTLAYNKAIIDLGPNQQAAIDQIEKLGKSGKLSAAEVQTLIGQITTYTNGLHAIPNVVTTTLQLITPPGGYNYHAAGTEDAPGGWSVINEKGPELVWLPPHSKVLPAAATAEVMAGRAAPHFADGTGAAATTMGGLSRRDIVEAIIEGFSKVDLNMDGWQVGRGMARAALSRSGGG